MTYRLPLKVKSASFSRKPTKGFCALVCFTSPDTGDFPFSWPDHTFELRGEDASTIMQAGRHGLVLASVKAKDEDPETWQLGAVTCAA